MDPYRTASSGIARNPEAIRNLIEQYGGEPPRKKPTGLERFFSLLSFDQWSDDVVEYLRRVRRDDGSVDRSQVMKEAGLFLPRYILDAGKHIAGFATGDYDLVDPDRPTGKDVIKELQVIADSEKLNRLRASKGLEPKKFTSEDWAERNELLGMPNRKDSPLMSLGGFVADVITPATFTGSVSAPVKGATSGALKVISGGLKKAGVSSLDELGEGAAKALVKEAVESTGAKASKELVERVMANPDELTGIVKELVPEGLYVGAPITMKGAKPIALGKTANTVGRYVENPLFAAMGDAGRLVGRSPTASKLVGQTKESIDSVLKHLAPGKALKDAGGDALYQHHRNLDASLNAATYTTENEVGRQMRALKVLADEGFSPADIENIKEALPGAAKGVGYSRMIDALVDSKRISRAAASRFRDIVKQSAPTVGAVDEAMPTQSIDEMLESLGVRGTDPIASAQPAVQELLPPRPAPGIANELIGLPSPKSDERLGILERALRGEAPIEGAIEAPVKRALEAPVRRYGITKAQRDAVLKHPKYGPQIQEQVDAALRNFDKKYAHIMGRGVTGEAVVPARTAVGLARFTDDMSLEEVLRSISDGELTMEDIPPDLREKIVSRVNNLFDEDTLYNGFGDGDGADNIIRGLFDSDNSSPQAIRFKKAVGGGFDSGNEDFILGKRDWDIEQLLKTNQKEYKALDQSIRKNAKEYLVSEEDIIASNASDELTGRVVSDFDLGTNTKGLVKDKPLTPKAVMEKRAWLEDDLRERIANRVIFEDPALSKRVSELAGPAAAKGPAVPVRENTITVSTVEEQYTTTIAKAKERLEQLKNSTAAAGEEGAEERILAEGEIRAIEKALAAKRLSGGLEEAGTYAVVGSRGFTDKKAVFDRLDQLLEEGKISKIVSGGAKGPDSFAVEWAKKNGIPYEEIIPDWSKGKGAGLARNTDIVKGSDNVLAFWDGASRGTKDSIDKARRLGKNLEVFKKSPLEETLISTASEKGRLYGSPSDVLAKKSDSLDLALTKLSENLAGARKAMAGAIEMVPGEAPMEHAQRVVRATDAIAETTKGVDETYRAVKAAPDKMLELDVERIEEMLAPLVDSGDLSVREAEAFTTAARAYQGSSKGQEEVLSRFIKELETWGIPKSDKANLRAAFARFGEFYNRMGDWDDPVFRKEALDDLTIIERSLDNALTYDESKAAAIKAVKDVIVEPARFQIQNLGSGQFRVGPAYIGRRYEGMETPDIEAIMNKISNGHKKFVAKPMIDAINATGTEPLVMKQSLEDYARAFHGRAVNQEAIRAAVNQQMADFIELTKQGAFGDAAKIIKRGKIPDGYVKLGHGSTNDKVADKMLDAMNIYVKREVKTEYESLMKYFTPKAPNELASITRRFHNVWKMAQTGAGINLPYAKLDKIGNDTLRTIAKYYNDNLSHLPINPGFTVGNFMSNLTVMVLKGDMSPMEAVRAYADGVKVVEMLRLGEEVAPNLGPFQALTKLSDAPGLKTIADDVVKSGVMESSYARHLGGEVLAAAPGESLPATSLGTLSDALSGSRAMGMNAGVEEAAKIGIFAKMRSRGYSIDAARRAAQEAFFDYSEATAFERDFVRPWTVFYTWTKKNVELMYWLMKNEPKKMKAYGSMLYSSRNFGDTLTEEERAAMPQWLRKYASIPFVDEEGNLSSISGFRTNIEAMADTLGDDPRDFALGLVGMMAPIPKVALERTFGYNTFKDRPISEDTSAYSYRALPEPIKEALGVRETNYEREGGESFTSYQMDPDTKYMIEALISRPIAGVSKQAAIMRGEQPAGPGLLDLFTGLKYNTYDTDYLKYSSQKKEYDELMAMLEQMGILNKNEYFYLDKGAEQNYPGVSELFGK